MDYQIKIQNYKYSFTFNQTKMQSKKLTGLCPAEVMQATLSLYSVPGSKLSRKNSVSGPV